MSDLGYKPNSRKYKEDLKEEKAERKIEKVVTKPATLKKKSSVQKLTSALISEDANNVKSYVLLDVVLPAVKKLISDIVRDGIDMILYGSSGYNKKSDRFSSEYVSYNRFSDKKSYRTNEKTKARFDYDDIIFETRGQVEAVREQMSEVIGRYGYVTVADLYDMADLTAPYTSNKYGWTTVRTAEAVRVRDGYILKLPRALPLDD